MSLARRGQRGIASLGETVLACFVLLFAMLVSSSLYSSALNHSVRIDRKQRAARVAEQQIERIRSWSRANHGTNGDLEFDEGWNTFNGVTAPDPDNPGYTVSTTITPKDLFSPSSEFEQINFAALEDDTIPDDSPQQRTLGNSSYLATVTVSWGAGAANRLVTRTLLTDPVRDHGWDANNSGNAITIEYFNGGSWSNAAPTFLPRGGQLPLRALIEDRHGEPVENPVVTWYIDPDCTGNGIIRSQPDTPERATFRNEFEVDQDPDVNGDELTVYTGGQVVLVSRVRLGGVEAVQKSPPITLGE